jgi:hypothetical protein
VQDPLALSQDLLGAVRVHDTRVMTLAAHLAEVDPAALVGDSLRTAFWLNVYNALMRHAVSAFGLSGDLRRHRGVFTRAVWHVGGRACTPHVIEHGILRGNRPAPHTFWRPLRSGDPRAAWAPSRLDPRIHFALNCGAVSCPPIRAYDAAKLDEQLELATRSYLAGEVAVGEAGLTLPYLCRLYRADFGDGLLPFVAAHADAETGAWIERQGKDARVRWGPYRWEIGGGALE